MANLFLARLANKEEFEAGIPANQESITKAEKDLGLLFSDEYKEYLLKYGSAAFHGHDYTGISRFPGVDVVAVTTEAREYNPDIPKDCYVIEETHLDGMLIWQNKAGEVFLSAPGVKAKKISDSLAEYIEL